MDIKSKYVTRLSIKQSEIKRQMVKMKTKEKFNYLKTQIHTFEVKLSPGRQKGKILENHHYLISASKYGFKIQMCIDLRVNPERERQRERGVGWGTGTGLDWMDL